MSTPIYAPFSQSYATREPYITQAEYIASPTGMDVSQLVPGGTVQQNSDTLDQTIDRASSAADMMCNQILAATLEVQADNYRIQPDGSILIACDQSPIFAIYGLSFNGVAVTDLSALTSAAISRKVVQIPAAIVANATPTNGYVHAALTYIAGYANSIMTAPSIVGDVTQTFDNTLGFAPGMIVKVNDPGATETRTVLSVTATTVTYTAPLAYPHAAGVNVSALPPAVKQAVVLLTTALIKTRGDAAFVFASTRETPDQKQGIAPGIPDELMDAQMLLANFTRVV